MFALNENVEFDRPGDESILHLPSDMSLALNRLFFFAEDTVKNAPFNMDESNHLFL